MITFADDDALDNYTRRVLLAFLERSKELSVNAMTKATEGLPEKAAGAMRAVHGITYSVVLADATHSALPKVPR